MTLANDNPTILEECQLRMHVDRVENMLCDSYIVEFAYDPTFKYYESHLWIAYKRWQYLDLFVFLCLARGVKR